MRYVCLVYFEPGRFFTLSPEGHAEFRRETTALDDHLKADGRLVFAQALGLPEQAVTLRVRDGKLKATDGPFIETKEILGGLFMMEARDMAEAIQLAQKSPFTRVGSVEVRPVLDMTKPFPRAGG